MVATAPDRRHVATLDRWVKALERSALEGINAFQISSTGQWVVTSASDPLTAYATDGIDCDCLAAVNGDCVCKHRAIVLHLTGRLMIGPALPITIIDLDPEPTPPAPADAAIPSPYTCSTCEDTGAITVENRIRPGLTFRKPCPDCRTSVPTLTFAAKPTTEGDQPSPSTRWCRACDHTGTALDDAGRFSNCRDCMGTGEVPCAVASPDFAGVPIAV